MQHLVSEIIEKEIAAIRNIPVDGMMEKAVNLILEQVHKLGGKVVVSGMGKAGQIGHNIAMTLCSTGTIATFLHPSEAQHGDLGMITSNDLLFLISNSGKTREILELHYLAQHLTPGIKVICLTGNADSELAQKADVVLNTGNPAEVCPLGLTPTTSTTCMTIVGDILVVSLMKAINFTKEEYAKRHHSGYLGQKARQ